jgi:hypothetical protein
MTSTIKISQLPPVTGALSSTDVVAAVQSGTTVKATVASFGYQPSGTGAVATTIQAKLRQTVSVKDFGAVGDGTTDDTVAVQAAIDAALASNVGLVVSGKCLITSSLIINRLVDTSKANFDIIGAGYKSGFYCTTAIKLFDSTLAFSTDPISERIAFKDIHFECSNNSLGAYVASNKFLRMNFISCFFEGIKCVTSTIYLQSWYFNNCVVHKHDYGFFFNTVGCYDISFIGNLVEGPGGNVNAGFFKTLGGAGCNGVRFLGNCVQNLGQSVAQIDGANGVTISGNYFELNGRAINPQIHLFTGSLPAQGLVISGNLFSSDNSLTAPCIYWGVTTSATSHDNYCVGVLHNADDTDAASRANIYNWGDYATVTLWTSKWANNIANTIVTPIKTITLGSGGAFAIAANQYSFFTLITGGSPGNSCNFPTGGTVGQRISIQIINSSGGAITSWTFTGNYKYAAWASLAVGYVRTIDFVFDGTYWREVACSPDIPA